MMYADFWMIILVHLLGCMSPGPDFVVIVKNALSHNRNLAWMSAVGVSAGILMHTTYCALGLGLVLFELPYVFKWLKLLGAIYLFYLGAKIFLSKAIVPVLAYKSDTKPMTAWQAFRMGFFTNALNPKAMLFVLGLFIIITKTHNPWWSVFFVIEMTVVTFLWFSFLVYCFTHHKVKHKLLKGQVVISKLLAIFLWIFALQLLLGQS